MITLQRLRGDRTAILKIAGEYGVRNIRVFGSVARDDNREDSDVDFLVELEKGRTLFDLAGFMADMRDLLGAPVDVATPGGLKYLREQILAEAEPL